MTPLVLLALLLSAAPAPSPDAATTEAKAHFRAATEAYRRADYPTAIAEFQAAYAAKPAPVLHYNLAQCYERSGDIANALQSYHRYLHESPGADDRATVQVAIGNLERRLQERGVQQLLVYSEPTAAQLRIDGLARGTTPASTELTPGKHQVHLELPGYVPADRQVNISADKSLELDFALQRATAEPRPTADLNPHPATTAQEPASVPARSSDEVQASGAQHPRIFTWVAAGLAGVAAVGGVGFGVSASSNSNSLTGSVHDHKDAQSLHDTAQSNAHTANILYGVAGVAGAAAITLFFVEGTF